MSTFNITIEIEYKGQKYKVTHENISDVYVQRIHDNSFTWMEKVDAGERTEK